MKCRRCGTNNNIIWFGKDEPDRVHLVIGYTTTIDDASHTFEVDTYIECPNGKPDSGTKIHTMTYSTTSIDVYLYWDSYGGINADLYTSTAKTEQIDGYAVWTSVVESNKYLQVVIPYKGINKTVSFETKPNTGDVVYTCDDGTKVYINWSNNGETLATLLNNSSVQIGNGYWIEEAYNYASDTDGVVASLIQRLSVIKGELWYQCNFGLPLMDKLKNKTILDASVLSIITSHPCVAGVTSYTSSITEHTYTIDCAIQTIFGDTVSISNSSSL